MTPNKKLTSKLIALTCIASLILAFSACKKDGSITISKEEQLKQTAYADETTTGNGFTFTFTGGFRLHPDNVSWMHLVMDGAQIEGAFSESTYSGTRTIVINLDINYTGIPRSASIVIESITGNSMITISVTQQGTTKDGEIPESPNVPLVDYIKFYYGAPIFYTYNTENRLSSINCGGNIVTITYPSANTIIATDNDPIYGEEYVFTLNNDGYVVKIKRSSGFEEYYEYEKGYLIKGGGGVANCTWVNGNLMSVQYENYDDTHTYSYGTIPSKKTNIASWTTPMSIIGDGGEFCYHYFPSAYFGKSSKNLVSSEIRNGNIQNVYRYETNNDGYITKIYNTMTLIEEGETHEVLWCEIQYK